MPERHDSPNKNPHTVMSPTSLPENFNFANFIRGLSMLDANLRQTLHQLEAAQKDNNKEAAAKFEQKKNEQIEAIMVFLEDAYMQTNAAIADIPQFNPKNEKGIKLSIPYDGQLLWFKIKYRIQQIREAHEEKAEQIMRGRIQ